MRILEAYSRKGGPAGRKEVTYYQRKWGGKPRGRRFAPGSLSLQSISRPVRHTIAQGLYFDADMRNCHPVALAHFCKLHHIPCPHLEWYAQPNKNRDDIFAALIQATANTSMPLDKDGCKRLVLKVMNGGSVRQQTKAWGDATPEWIHDFCNELDGVREALVRMFPEEYSEAKAYKDWNASGTLLNRLLNIIEDNMLQQMFKFFHESGHTPEVLCFDGFMVPRAGFTCKEDFEALCEECTKYIHTETGYPLKVVHK
jgi:hypothetical protein